MSKSVTAEGNELPLNFTNEFKALGVRDRIRGRQVAYVPRQARNEDETMFDPNHPDVEWGFITSCRGQAFCRFWISREAAGTSLRNRANSEATAFANLMYFPSTHQETVDLFLQNLPD